MITVTTSTSRRMINLSSKPKFLLILIVRIAASEAMVIFTMVLLMTIVMSSCLGKLISLLICLSGGLADILKLFNWAAVSEKKAVSEPEKNAEQASSSKKIMLYKSISGPKLVE